MPDAKPRLPLYDQLNALLHTMRCIELQEPQLCTLLHELKTAKKVTPKLAAEIRAALETVPGRAFVNDLEAVERALEA